MHIAAAALLLGGCLPSASASGLPPAAVPVAPSAGSSSAPDEPPPPVEAPDPSSPVPDAPPPAGPADPAAAHAGHDVDYGPLPEGDPGTTEALIGPDTNTSPIRDDGSGAAFRVVCDFTHMAADDPIVKPGQPGASHLHTFFGNANIDANTTAENIRENPRSACHGGTVNSSGYWVPTVLDADGKPVAPVNSDDWKEAGERGVYFHPNNFYYKRTFAPNDREITAPPPGFRMIVGDAKATTTQEDKSYEFRCEDGTPGEKPKGLQGEIPRCSQGQVLVLSIVFPDCWDGTNLDSDDHKSHVARGTDAGCPDTHPVRIPTITMNVRWPVWDHESTEGWRLASDVYEGPGGFSAHADWFNGWDQEVFEGIVENCLNRGVNCGNQRLNNGQQLLAIPEG